MHRAEAACVARMKHVAPERFAMSKAEEIAETTVKRLDNQMPGRFQVALAAVHNALEWAAQRCEAIGKEYGIRDGMPAKCAEAIRAGKSQQ